MNITQQERDAIKTAMKNKLRELNGSVLTNIDKLNERNHNVKSYSFGISWKTSDVVTGVIKIDIDKYYRIVNGIITVKDENYFKIVKFFKLKK